MSFSGKMQSSRSLASNDNKAPVEAMPRYGNFNQIAGARRAQNQNSRAQDQSHPFTAISQQNFQTFGAKHSSTKRKRHHHHYPPPPILHHPTDIPSYSMERRFIQTNSSFPLRTRPGPLAQYSSYDTNTAAAAPTQPVETQSYENEPKGEMTDDHHINHTFINMFALPPAHPEPACPLSDVTAPLTAWQDSVTSWESKVDLSVSIPNYAPSPAATNTMEMASSQRIGEEQHSSSTTTTADRDVGPSQEAWSFTWDSKGGANRSLLDRVRPKRRKLTPSERARTKALKLAGGACESCRKKKKKCTHKDLTELLDEDDSNDENHTPQPQSLKVASVDSGGGGGGVQSRLYEFSTSTASSPYLSRKESATATLAPASDHITPSEPRAFLDENYHEPGEDFGMDTAGFGHQFSSTPHTPIFDNMYADIAGNEINVMWFQAMGYNSDHMYQQF